jgi:hypothetical protein
MNYDKYKIDKKNYTFDEICNTHKFELQPQQNFYLNICIII